MTATRYMTCQGCGATFRPGEEDMYVEHVQNCEYADGTGNPRTATCRHCSREIQPGLAPDGGMVAWVHSEDDDVLCWPEDNDSPHAEPTD